MSANNFGDSMDWGRGRSSGSRKGKRAGGGGGSSSDKPRQPQRGLGVAQLEKIRIQSEMAEYLRHPHPLGQPPPLTQGTGSLSLEDARSSNSQSPSPSSSLHANNVSSPYPIHPNLMMSYGGGGDTRYGEFQSTPTICRSPPDYHEAAKYYSSAHRSNDASLALFEPEELSLKRHHDLNQSADSSTSMNSDDPQDLDLELKL